MTDQTIFSERNSIQEITGPHPEPAETLRCSAIMVGSESGGVDEELLDAYRRALDEIGDAYEFLCVVPFAQAESLKRKAAAWPQLRVVGLRPWRSQEAAFSAALRRARGPVVLSLAYWFEIDPASIRGLIEGLGDADLAIAARERPTASRLQRLRVAALDGLIQRLFGHGFSDVFCRARVGRRALFEEVGSFGVRQHFLPLIALFRGYKVREIPVAISSRAPHGYKIRLFANFFAMLDVFSLYVALNFVRRPLRFFGAIGLPIFLAGLVVALVLVGQRVLLEEPLADRPALILSVLAIVLGVQIVALGLVGEIIVFASSRRLKAYDVERVIRAGEEE